MLEQFTTARDASHHSPIRERRELFFATKPPRGTGGHPEHDGDAERVEGHEEASSVRDTIDQGAAATATRVGRLLRDVDAPADILPPHVRVAVERTRGNVRGLVNDAIGEIVEIPMLKEHTAAESATLSVRGLLEEHRARIIAKAEYQLSAVDQDTTEAELQTIERVIEPDLRTLAEFKNHLFGIKERLMAGRFPKDPKVPEVAGYYERAHNEIFLSPQLQGQARQDVLDHERGHAILHAVERYLSPTLYRDILDGKEGDADLLDHLDTLTEDADYAKDGDARLMQRYIDSRFETAAASIDASTPKTDKRERAAFALLDKRPALQEGPLLASFERAMLEELKLPGNGELITQMAEFAYFLEDLRRDETMDEEYDGCKENEQKLLVRLIARFGRWRLHADPNAFTSKAELKLLSHLERAYLLHFQASVAKELRSAREMHQNRERFNAMLDGLALTPKNAPPGHQVHEWYRLYGADRPALLEELINRHADYRARPVREGKTYTHLDEVCLFVLLDPKTEILPPFTRAQVDAHLSGADAPLDTPQEQDDEGVDGGIRASHGGGDHGGEEGETVTLGSNINGHQLQHTVGEQAVQMKTISNRLANAPAIINDIAPPAVARGLISELTMHSADLSHALSMNADWQRCAQVTEDWARGKVSEGEFLSVMRRFAGPESFEALATVASLPVSERRKHANDALKDIKQQVTQWDEQLQKMGDYLDELDKKKDAKDKQGSLSEPFLEVYSINQWIGAIGNVYDSYKKAWAQWYQLKESKLSKHLGDLVDGLPMSDRAKITLEMELDHKNDETKDNFKKHLEHDLADFDHVVGGHGHHSLLDQHKEDPNHFRGTLEYMASKAWLYDFDIKNRVVFGIPLKVGVNLPANWTDKRVQEYLRDLEQKQSSGEKSEAERGKSRVNNYSDIPPMIDVMQDELERNNYWATYGILERIAEKGKYPNSPIWASVTILNHIRDNPNAKKFFPKKLTDKLGTSGLEYGMIHKFFKLDRHPIARFQNGGVPFERAGNFASIVSAVERRLIALSGLPSRDKLEPWQKNLLHKQVSEVLASQTVKVMSHGHEVSVNIFDDNPPEFREYREFLENFDNTFKAKDLDDDYVNPSQPEAELSLGSSNYFFALLETASEGAFKTGQKGKMFMEKLVVQDKRIEDEVMAGRLNVSVLRNFRKATRAKMDNVAYSSWVQGNPQVTKYKCTVYKDPETGESPIILSAMLKRGLISVPVKTATMETMPLVLKELILINNQLPPGAAEAGQNPTGPARNGHGRAPAGAHH